MAPHPMNSSVIFPLSRVGEGDDGGGEGAEAATEEVAYWTARMRRKLTGEGRVGKWGIGALLEEGSGDQRDVDRRSEDRSLRKSISSVEIRV